MASYEDGDEVKNNLDDSISNLMNHLKRIQLTNENNENDLSKKAVPEWLKDIESPFLWHTQLKRAKPIEHMIKRALEKLYEFNLDNPEFSLRRYSVLLKLVLEFSLAGHDEKVKETMQTIHIYLDKDRVNKCPEYVKYECLLKYLVSATEANLLALKGQEEKSKQIADSLVPIQDLPISIQAGLCAMKTNFFFFNAGYDDQSDIVGFAKEALRLEPNNHEWKFLLAKTLRQQRKEAKPFSTDLPNEEIFLLEEAVEQSRNYYYLHYLAQVYMECGSNTNKKYRTQRSYYSSTLYKTVQDMQKRSLNLYKEALAANPESAANLRRVGYGIMNLPPKLADYKLAIDCLLKSLELSYTLNTLHMIGTYYHRYGNDNKKALEYLKKTVDEGCHAGLSDMVRIKFMEDPLYDPCPDLEKGLEWNLKTKNRCFILAQLAGYYLFIKRDLIKSIQYVNQLIITDKDSTQIKVYKCLFLRMYDPVDLYYYIMNEAMLFLKNKNAEEEDIYKVMALIKSIRTINPALAKIKANAKLIPALLKFSEEIFQKDKNKKPNSRPHQYINKRGNESSQGFHNGGGGRGGTFRPRFEHRGGDSRGPDFSGRNKTNQYDKYDDLDENSWKLYGNRMGKGNKREKNGEWRNWRKSNC